MKLKDSPAVKAEVPKYNDLKDSNRRRPRATRSRTVRVRRRTAHIIRAARARFRVLRYVVFKNPNWDYKTFNFGMMILP